MKEDQNKSYPQGWATCHNEYLGVDIAPSPNYAKLAEAFGSSGEKIEKPDDVRLAMKRALRQLKQGKFALLDVVIDSPDS
jgi:acetolactate synthase-1/2/3 large subunit